MARILVIDDDRDIVRLAAIRLSRIGHTVEERYDGATGLAAIRELRPDLAIVDWMMPGLDGIAVAQAVRADSATSAIPLVLLTARSDPAEHEYARTQGFSDVVTKPFTKTQLFDAVAALLPVTN
ncbi:response regulator [Microbacterium sediminicola]|uniref:response regulator n=1 Tax=Microbacterium sediminicola TaxID=415210 RepID=UPI0031D34CF4